MGSEIFQPVDYVVDVTCVGFSRETMTYRLAAHRIFLINEIEREKYGYVECIEWLVGGANMIGSGIKLIFPKPEGDQTCIGNPFAVL